MKILKSIFPIILMGFSFVVNAQTENKSNGIYLTKADFINHKILLPAGDKGKMRLHEFFGSSYISMGQEGGYRKTYPKDDVYGYRNKGKDFRIYKKKSYQIVDTSGFVMYSSDVLVQKGKGFLPVTAYFFSEKAKTDILPLTKENLSQVFSGSPEFRYAAESCFRNDEELMTYDNTIKQYKLKYLFFKSVKPALAAK